MYDNFNYEMHIMSNIEYTIIINVAKKKKKIEYFSNK